MRLNPFDNLLLKISALLLALLLWVHVATNKTYEHEFHFPFKVVGIPKDLVLVSDLPAEANVNIRATGKQLISLALDVPEIEILASGYKAGTYQKQIEDADVAVALNGPYEKVNVMMTEKITLKFERLVEKMVAVLPAVTVHPATGFLLVSKPIIAPESVKVWGPASIIHHLSHLTTEVAELADVQGPVSKSLRLDLPDSLRLKASDTTVTISVTAERGRQIALTGVPISHPPGFNAERYGTVPQELSLLLEVPESLAGSLNRDDFKISFHMPPSLRDSAKVPIKYTLPKNVGIVPPIVDSLLIVRKP